MKPLNNFKIIFLIKDLFLHLNISRKKQLIFVAVFSVITSIFEVVNIGAIFPFLAAISNPDFFSKNNNFKFVINFFNLNTNYKIILAFTIFFIFTILLASIFRVINLKITTNFAFAMASDVSIRIYNNCLYQPYSIHINRNTSQIIDAIATKSNVLVYTIIQPLMLFINSIILLPFVLIILLFVNPYVAFFIFVGIGLIYIAINLYSKKKLLINGQKIAFESERSIRLVQESLGAIRDILIDSAQPIYCDAYKESDLNLRRAQSDNVFMSQFPRFLIETLGISLIACVAFNSAINSQNNFSNVIPILGAFALAAQRTLPMMHQIYSSLSSMRSGSESLVAILDLLNQSNKTQNILSKEKSIDFEKKISLKKLFFRYEKNRPFILNKINLTIKKGEIIGFIGPTGSGKTTLLDVIMGLLHPESGSLNVDDIKIDYKKIKGWQKLIAHVPQNIFLIDTTIESNIAFGVPNECIDHNRVKKVSKQAQLDKLIESWPDKYQTFVGERGIRLSGGQRQRIGIARALYKQAKIIVFDEATSALDIRTEKAVMEAIEGLSKDLTILIIAHRLSTLKNCTRIIELSNGSIKRIGTYNQILSLNE